VVLRRDLLLALGVQRVALLLSFDERDQRVLRRSDLSSSVGAQAVEGHGIGSSDDPFINGPSVGFPEAFHPNAAGYRAYAKAISAAIRNALDRQKQLT
jgi:lysophospholipase L1-like esterase